jgi:hypothetical protein
MVNQFIVVALITKLEQEINVYVVLRCAISVMLNIYWKCTLSNRIRKLSESGVVIGTTIFILN